MVQAQDLVFDYFAKGVEDCSRKTHIIPTSRNEIHEKILMGTFLDIREEGWYTTNAQPLNPEFIEQRDDRNGRSVTDYDEDTPYTLLEQHLLLDLDKDGYKEPYVCTVEVNSRQVLRLVARFETNDVVRLNEDLEGDIVKIKPMEYFTKYEFIPAPDGGAYGMGFGQFIGPLNEAANSLVNQLIDAGTMANTGGGFIGRGAKIKSGMGSFSPFEWKYVDSSGDDLKKSIFPLPVREPSAVLFQLLTFMVLGIVYCFY